MGTPVQYQDIGHSRVKVRLAKADIPFGQKVKCDDGITGIVVDKRGLTYKILTDDGTFTYDRSPSPGDFVNPTLDDILGYYHIIKESESKYRGLTKTKYVKKWRGGDGKWRYEYRVAKEKSGQTFTPSPEQSSRFMPSEQTHASIQSGDKGALADYVMEAFWVKHPETDETLLNSMAKNLPRTRMEGFEAEDMAQEAALRLLMKQADGSLASISRKDFPGYVVNTYRNVGRELARKHRDMARQSDIDPSEMADYLESTQTLTPEEEFIKKEERGKIQQVYSDTVSSISTQQKVVLNKVLEGKKHEQISNEMGITRSASEQAMKIANNKIKSFMDASGFKGANLGNQFKGAWEKLGLGGYKAAAKSFTAKKINGKWMLIKAEYKNKAKVGGKWVYDYGQDDKRTDPYFKKKGDSEEKPSDDKGKTADGIGDKKTIEKIKDAMKSALKKVIETFAASQAGQSGIEEASAGAQEAGARIKDIGKSKGDFNKNLP